MTKLTALKIKKITDALVAKKHSTRCYNAALSEKQAFKITGIKRISFSMSISTYDNKPFNKKRVRIVLHGAGEDCFMQRDVFILSPVAAGYRESEVMSRFY